MFFVCFFLSFLYIANHGHQASGSISRVFCGPDSSLDVLPHHARAQPGLECGAVRRGPLHQGVWLGPKAGDRPHSLGCRH